MEKRSGLRGRESNQQEVDKNKGERIGGIAFAVSVAFCKTGNDQEDGRVGEVRQGLNISNARTRTVTAEQIRPIEFGGIVKETA